jgi:hypothetical protein
MFFSHCIFSCYIPLDFHWRCSPHIVFPCIVILLFITFFCYFSCATTLFFSCSRYLATKFALLHYSFCIVALLLSNCLVLLALMCYSFHVTLLFFSCCCIVFLTLPLLLFSWCPCWFSHIVVLLFSCYIAALLTLSFLSHWCCQSWSTYLPNSWCCYFHIIIIVIFALVLMLFPWLVWYFPSPSCHV